jgi:hypothetical protein
VEPDYVPRIAEVASVLREFRENALERFDNVTDAILAHELAVVVAYYRLKYTTWDYKKTFDEAEYKREGGEPVNDAERLALERRGTHPYAGYTQPYKKGAHLVIRCETCNEEFDFCNGGDLGEIFTHQCEENETPCKCGHPVDDHEPEDDLPGGSCNYIGCDCEIYEEREPDKEIDWQFERDCKDCEQWTDHGIIVHVEDDAVMYCSEKRKQARTFYIKCTCGLPHTGNRPCEDYKEREPDE